jgi:hypothetical protein
VIGAALSFLREQPNVDPDRIVLYGYSRGAIASAMVAAQDANLRAGGLSTRRPRAGPVLPILINDRLTMYRCAHLFWSMETLPMSTFMVDAI